MFSVGKREKTGLEYFPDSPEFIAQTVDLTGFREQIGKAFHDAIERAADTDQYIHDCRAGG